MKTMNICKYIKLYCDNKWSIWEEKSKTFPKKFECGPYTDDNYWYDEKNQIIIKDSYYICD